MCKITNTHYSCLCTALVVHSCSLNFPLGRMVCGPPNLIKKDIYVYSNCDDCLNGAPLREERRARKINERWMSIVRDILDGDDEDDGQGGEEMGVECEDGRAAEVYNGAEDLGRDAVEGEWNDMMRRQRNKGWGDQEEIEDEDEDGDEDAQLAAAQEAIQAEFEHREDAPDENDDLAAAAQLLSALKQELGKDGVLSSDADIGEIDEGEGEGEDQGYQRHVQMIMESLGKLREREVVREEEEEEEEEEEDNNNNNGLEVPQEHWVGNIGKIG